MVTSRGVFVVDAKTKVCTTRFKSSNAFLSQIAENASIVFVDHALHQRTRLSIRTLLRTPPNPLSVLFSLPPRVVLLVLPFLPFATNVACSREAIEMRTVLSLEIKRDMDTRIKLIKRWMACLQLPLTYYSV